MPPASGTSATATSAFESDVDKPELEIKPSEKVPSPVPEVPEEMGVVSSSFQEMSGKSESEDSSSISASANQKPGVYHSTPAKMKPFDPSGMEENAETYDYVSTDDEIAPISASKSGSEFLENSGAEFVEKKEFSSRTVDESTGERTYLNAEEKDEKDAEQGLQDIIQTATSRIAQSSNDNARSSSGVRSPLRRSAVIAEVAKPIISSRLESRMKDEIQTEEDLNSMVDFVAEKIKPEVAQRYTGSSSSSIASENMPTHEELEDIVDNELRNLTDSEIREGGVKHKAIRLVESKVLTDEDVFGDASTGDRAELLTNEALPFITKKASLILDQSDAKPEDLIRSSEYIAEKTDARFTQIGDEKPDLTTLRKSVDEITEGMTKNELQEAIQKQKNEDRQARNKTAMIIEAAKPIIREEIGNRFANTTDQSEVGQANQADLDSTTEFIAEAIKPTVESQFGKSKEAPTGSQLRDIIGSTLKNYSDAEINEGAKHADKISSFRRRSSSGTLEKFKKGSVDEKETILDRETVPIVSNMARNILGGNDQTGSTTESAIGSTTGSVTGGGTGSGVGSSSAQPDDLVAASAYIHEKVRRDYKQWTDQENKPNTEELSKSINEITKNISKSDLDEAIFLQSNVDKRAGILVNDSKDIVNYKVEQKLANTPAAGQQPILTAASNIVTERLADKYKEEFGTADRKPSRDTLKNIVESAVNSYSTNELVAAAQDRSGNDGAGDLGAMSQSDNSGDESSMDSMLDRSAVITESIKPIVQEKLEKRFVSDKSDEIDSKVDFISDSIKPNIISDYVERSKPVKLVDLENIIDSKLSSLTDADINQGADETRVRSNISDSQFSNVNRNKKAEILVSEAAPSIVKAVGEILGDDNPERLVPASEYVADIAKSQFKQDFGHLQNKPDTDTVNRSIENITRDITKEELERVISGRDIDSRG